MSITRGLRLRSFCAALIALMIGGCGTSAPRWWEATAPTPSTAPVPGTSTPTRQFHLLLEPSGLNGGETATGTLTMNVPAPDSGLVISLSSGNAAAAQVPASITIPPGGARVSFPITTRPVPGDVRAEIVASILGTSSTATIDVWAILPTSFSYVSENGDTTGLGRTGRLTPATSSFVARCENGSDVWVMINSPDGRSAFLQFGAPRGTPLRAGTYEGATRTAFRSATAPGIDVSVNGSGCNTTTGRFVVSEADFSTTGEIRRFVVAFEQHCNAMPPALRGELRLTGPFPMPPFQLSCLR